MNQKQIKNTITEFTHGWNKATDLQLVHIVNQLSSNYQVPAHVALDYVEQVYRAARRDSGDA